jgi:hypothetical protein
MMRGTTRLLLLDGHGSHTTLNFIEYCDSHDIIPFLLPPHSTHLLQPLDLAVFSPFKHHHAEAVDAATRTGCTLFNKVKFLASLNSIRKATFKPNTIKTSWRLAGISPWRPESVIEQLHDPKPYTVPQDWDNPPSTPPCSSPHVTPKTIRSLKRVGDSILNRPEPVSPTLKRFISGSMMQAHLGAQLAEDFERHTRAARDRIDRQGCKRIVATGGVLRAEDARAIAEERQHELDEQVQRREWPAIKRETRLRLMEGWQAVFAALKARNRKAKPLRKLSNKQKAAVAPVR